MNKPLAIVTPEIGVRSETFIRRHIQDLFPEGTVAVAAVIKELGEGDWSVDCPVLAVNWIPQSGLIGRGVQLKTYIVKALAQNFDWRAAERHWVDAKQFLREHKVQVIMGEYLDQCFPWIQVARELGVQFFCHAHGYDVSSCLRDAKWRKKYLQYNETGGIITVSHASRERLLALGLLPDKVHVVPCGIDVPAKPLKRTEQETVRCLAVGRMVAKKAPLKTLEAFRQAVEAHPKLRLDYVGAGELLPAAQQFVRTFSLEKKVTLHGSQPNKIVLQLMKNSDIYMQHSISDPVTGNEEGLPVGILEAMAHSLPVVSTRHAGIPEAVLDGFNGYLVAEGDSAEMGERLVMLACDPDLRQRMGEVGWHRAKEKFSWEKERRELLKILAIKSQTKDSL